MGECNELALAAMIADILAEGKTIPELCYLTSLLQLVNHNIHTIIQKRNCVAARKKLDGEEREDK